MSLAPRLSLGALCVCPPILLAPMAGLSHTAFRRLVREQGGVGLVTTEMVPARRFSTESPRSPYLCRHPSERPLSLQLLVGGADEIPSAVDKAHALGVDVLDLNLGCPAPHARRLGAGAWLARRPDEARRVVREARRRTSLPLTAKVRLGDRLREAPLRDLCRGLEDQGVDALTVHARLHGEPYGRPARWDWVGKVKGWVGVPVVANGGLFEVGDVRRCVQQSGCDAVMVGRGAAVRPWFPSVLAGCFSRTPAPSPPDRPALFRRFVDLLDESFRPERRLGRLKEFTHHFAGTYPFGHRLASAVQSAATLPLAVAAAEGFFERNRADT